MTRATPSEIKTALAAIPLWKRRKSVIARTFEFSDFPAAMKFVNRVAKKAEAADHHPDIDIRWNKAALKLTTHDAGGLTGADFALAQAIDRMVSDKLR